MHDIYLEAISTPYVGFGNKRVIEMLNHLYDVYAKILPNDLVLDNEKVNSPWDPNQPFEFLICQIQNGINFAAHRQVPYQQNK